MNYTFRKEMALSFLAALLGVFLLYGRTLFFDFVWDDYIEVLGNNVFHQPSNLWKFFTVPYWTLLNGGFAPYHRPMIPVMVLSVSLFFGKNPFGYHLLNLILYTLTCWVYYLAILKISQQRSIAVLAALLFLCHPVHAEAVAWGSARPVLLSGLCFISCTLVSFIIRKVTTAKKWLFLLISLFIFTVGLLTYHSILTFIPFIFISYFVLPKENSKQTLSAFNYIELFSYIALAVSFILYCLFLFHKMGETDLRPFYSPAIANMSYTGQPREVFLAPLNTLSRYFEILFFPVNLVPDVSFSANQLSLSALSVLVLFSTATYLLAKNSPLKQILIFSSLWILSGLLTVANFVPQGGLFSDRYSYLASMGACLWLSIFLHQITGSGLQRQKKRLLAATILLACLAAKTFTYSSIWRNDFTYWLEASILSPQKARTHEKLGSILESRGLLKEAVTEYKRTLELDSKNFPRVQKRLEDLNSQGMR